MKPLLIFLLLCSPCFAKEPWRSQPESLNGPKPKQFDPAWGEEWRDEWNYEQEHGRGDYGGRTTPIPPWVRGTTKSEPDYKAMYERELASKARTDQAFLKLLGEYQELSAEHKHNVRLMQRATSIIRGMRAEIETLHRLKLDGRTWGGR